jgi:hypothetical protein
MPTLQHVRILSVSLIQLKSNTKESWYYSGEIYQTFDGLHWNDEGTYDVTFYESHIKGTGIQSIKEAQPESVRV